MQNGKELWMPEFIFQHKIWWTGSTARGPGSVAWVCGGSRRRGLSARWIEAARTRGRGGSLQPRGVQALGPVGACRRRWRRTSQAIQCHRGAHRSTSGGAMDAKNGGGWSSARGRKKARGSSGERGKKGR
jgi:hypothetical protein